MAPSSMMLRLKRTPMMPLSSTLDPKSYTLNWHLSVTPSSMMMRLKRTPMMPLSSGTSSNSASGERHSGCRSRFLGDITISGLRNCRWICGANVAPCQPQRHNS